MKLINVPSADQWPDLLRRPALDTEKLFDAVRSLINKVRTEGDLRCWNWRSVLMRCVFRLWP